MDKEVWKILATEDGREILTALRQVNGLEKANNVLQRIMPIIVKYKAQYETSVSLSDKDISIILHGHSKLPIASQDWSLAKELEPFLI